MSCVCTRACAVRFSATGPAASNPQRRLLVLFQERTPVQAGASALVASAAALILALPGQDFAAAYLAAVSDPHSGIQRAAYCSIFWFSMLMTFE